MDSLWPRDHSVLQNWTLPVPSKTKLFELAIYCVMHSWVGAIAFVWIERRRRSKKTKKTHDRIGTCWCNEFCIRNCFGFGFIFSFNRCKTRSANIVRAGVWVCVHISCLCVFKYCKNYYYSNLILMPCSQTKWVLVRARRDCRRNQIKLCGQTKIVVWTFPPTKLHRELPLVLRLNDVTKRVYERERERASEKAAVRKWSFQLHYY